jgi:hypothetical protein
VGDSRKTRVEFDSAFKEWDSILIAQTQHDIGMDTGSLLVKAEVTIDKREEDFFWKPLLYGSLAEAYASCRDMDSSLRVVDKIMGGDSERTRHNREEALKKIAKERLRKGDTKAALAAARRTGLNLFITEIAANGAIVATQKESAVELIDIALNHVSQPLRVYKSIDGMEEHVTEVDKSEQAELYALIGRAKNVSGQDSTPLFSRALELASELQPGWNRAVTYNSIGTKQTLSGIDGTQAFGKASEEIDKHLTTNPNRHWIDASDDDWQMETIAEEQVECGRYDLAKETIEKFITSADIDKSIKSKEALHKSAVYLLSLIAGSQAKRGLSQEEISGLSPDEIRDLLKSPNELVAEAVVYFELDNRIL